jgi:hypothetical protein
MAEDITCDDLVGEWRLADWRTCHADGTVGHPFGPDAVGLLVYTASGVVSGQMTRADRPVFSRPRTQAVEFDAGDPAELAAAFNTFLSYAGRWHLGTDGLVRHEVEVASIPGWAGTTLLREPARDGSALVLRTPVRTVEGLDQRGVLRWEPV